MEGNNAHITPLKTYLMVAASLMVLTVVTVGVSFIDLGAYNITIALAIASVKALLVAFFFMHLFWDNKLYLVIFSVGLLFLTIFLTLTMFDTETRGSVNEETKRPIKQETRMIR